MEQQIIFREYQEQQAADHNDLQSFARASLDHLVLDAVTETRRYAGFNVAKSAQVEVQISPGRFYDVFGAVYRRNTTLVQSLITYLPAVASRKILVSVYGAETETEVEERDFLVDVDTGRTEPDAVATVRSRDAIITLTQGAESSDPQNPPTPINHAPIAYITLDTTQVVSVEMLTAFQVSSTEELDVRAGALETFRNLIEPRVSSLASDLAALANLIKLKSQQTDMTNIYRDIARIKERVEIPSEAADYGADRFLDISDSDTDDSMTYGYDALVQEGCRFADANADVFEMDIFSANDPNASKATNGLLLPAYTSVFKLGIGPMTSDLGIAQYGWQTFEMVQRYMSRTRLRYGSWFTDCTNHLWWQSGVYDSVTGTFQKDGETFEIVFNTGPQQRFHEEFRARQIWTDTYQEPYWEYSIANHSITGAMVAQSWLNSNDMWATRVRLFFTAKAAAENVFVTICEITNGVPDLDKVIMHQTLNHADMLVGAWTSIDIIPTFLKNGNRYALLVCSNANHKLAMASGQSYTGGTFFYSTDGAFFQGDLTKDMCMEIWGAQFNSPQVTIELEALNLDGGIRNIDILAGSISPESTQLVYEVQPSGSGAWIPLTQENLEAFTSAPPLCRFRARFIGTRDIHTGLLLSGSQCKLSRPKLALLHISEEQVTLSPAATVTVELLLENFDDTPHDCSLRLRDRTNGTWETPDATTDVVLDVAAKRVQRRFVFNTLISPHPTELVFEITCTTNSAANTFHVAERIFWITV